MKHLCYALVICWCFVGSRSPEFPAREGKDYALIFAIENYKYWSDLRYPIDDGEAVAEELRNKYGFKVELVKDPDRNTIYDKLNEYRDRSYQEDDQLFIFFSGHGTFIEDTKEGFLIPVDGRKNDRYQDTYIPHDRFKRAINAIPCKNILLAIDACFSGTLDDRIGLRGDEDNEPSWGRPTPQGAVTIDEIRIESYMQEHLQYQTRLYLTSGGKERTPDKSPFIYQFLTALRSTNDEDPLLTYIEIQGFLETVEPRPRTGTFGINEPGPRNFFFRRASSSVPPTIARPKAPAQEDRKAFEAARDCGSLDCYQRYLEDYPNGRYAPAAQLEIERLKEIPPEVPGMVFIQGGTFEMGDTFGEGGDDEKPVHTVTVSDYYLGRTEVSVGEFKSFIEATGYQTTADKEGHSYRWTGKWEEWDGVTWKDDAEGNKRPRNEYNHPVVHVSWYDAVHYCNWKSRQEGYQEVYTINGENVSANWSANGYRLPTEAEWEYAARNLGKRIKYAWGNEFPHGNVADESAKKKFTDWTIFEGYEDGYVYTAPVGSFEQGDQGLFDLSGNVWEWCWDWYGSDYYANSPTRDPRGPASGSYRVNRGGSWNSFASYCLVSYRYDFTPSFRVYYLGFRLSRSVP